MLEDYRRRLLRHARETLQAHFGLKPGSESESWALWPQALLPGGVFVTLTKGGNLRGCIGMIQSDRPRWENVQKMSLEAALEDPRFPAVQASEIPGLKIEISLLTDALPIPDWKSINLGTDGIILTMHSRRALFLPQVATEQKWDLETTLHHLCRKAGLHPNDWKNADCRFETFQAEHFQEHR